MKKTYIQPEMLAVVLLHQNNLLQNASPANQVNDVDSNNGIGMGSGSVEGGSDVKGSTNVWDEEW